MKIDYFSKTTLGFILLIFLTLLPVPNSFSANFRWVVYNNSQNTLKLSQWRAQVENTALPHKYFWSDTCRWIDRSTNDEKNLNPQQQRGWDCNDPQKTAINPKRKFRVWIQCPNGDEKYVYFPRDGGHFPRGYRSNTDVEYQLILESYDCA